jgi:hypothetical protein
MPKTLRAAGSLPCSHVGERLVPCSVCPSSARRSGSSVRRTACLLLQGKQAPRAGCSLATTFGTGRHPLPAVPPWSMRYCPVPPPFLASFPWIVCMCSYTTAMVRGALLVPSAHNKRSTGGRNVNGEHLDREREKAGSHRGLARALHAPSRQKRGSFPSGGTPQVLAPRDT